MSSGIWNLGVFSRRCTGEVPLYMPSGAKLTMQKGLTGSGGVAVKRGGGTWEIANETARTFSAGGIRIEGGPITFGNNKLNETSGFTLTFAGNDATEVITLNRSDMAVKDLTLAETADVDTGRDWGQEEKGTTEDEMAGWHH